MGNKNIFTKKIGALADHILINKATRIMSDVEMLL